jgi:hypothetical protein
MTECLGICGGLTQVNGISFTEGRFGAMKIAVAGLGYVGLSLAVLLSQHNEKISYCG